jgi:phage gpG-like protein
VAVLRVVFSADEVKQAMARAARAIPMARRDLLRNLAIQAERESIRLAGGSGAPGSYPIPIRTGTFRRGFGFELRDDHAIVFNETRYARAIHKGYRPYGNPHATPIPPRPYFDDALKALDLDAAAKAWEAPLQ